MQTKFCSTCMQHKPLTAFHKAKTFKDGLAYKCKDCCRTYKANHYQKNKDILLKKQKKYHDTNKTAIKGRRARLYQINREKILNACAAYRQANKEKIIQYQMDHKEQAKAYAIEYGKKPASFRVFALQLEPYEDVRNVSGVLEIRCAYCDQWCQPNTKGIQNRISAIKGQVRGERRLYCCQACKDACPSYWQIDHWRGTKIATSREVNAWIRQEVLERDDRTCQICGAGVKAQLHVHHVEPVALNPMEQLDKENMITLCKDCHINVHYQPGCRNHELRCT